MTSWTENPSPGELGGRSGYNRESETASKGYRWGGGRSKYGGGETNIQKKVEAGGTGDTRNKVNGSDRA